MTNPETHLHPVKPFDPFLYDDTLTTLDKYFTATGGFDYEVLDEGLPNESAGIMAPKHRGHLDPPLLAVVAHYEYKRRVRFLTAQRLLEGRLGSVYKTFFHELGCIMLNTSVPLDKQPAGQEVEGVIAANGILSVFPEGKIIEGLLLPDIKETHKVGPLATKFGVPITAFGVSGTEFELGQWFGPKYVVAGRTTHPDTDKLKQLDPEVRADKRELIRYSKALSQEVHTNIQEATVLAERRRSTRRFSFSRPKNTPKRDYLAA